MRTQTFAKQNVIFTENDTFINLLISINHYSFLSSPTPMKKLHHHTRTTILQLLDFFYPLFKKVMPLQTYRYAACGGINTILGIVLYSVGYNFIFKKQVVHLGYVPFYGNLALEPHIAADYLFAIWIVFPIGFYFSRYVVFQESKLRRRIQLFRYFLVTICSMLINYFGLKLFVDVCHFYPTPSKVATTVLVVGFSYMAQRHFSFKAVTSKADITTEL